MSSISFSKCRSVLARCVSRIFKCTAKPQMGRINAGRIVTTGAIVKNHHAFRNGPEVKNPTNPVSCFLFLVVQSVQFAVSFRILLSNPNPARFSRPNLRKESFWRERRKSLRTEIIGRNLLHRLVICPVGLQARRAFLISLILALPASLFSQGFTYRRPFVLTSASTATTNPAYLDHMWHYWVASDLATNAPVGEWHDRYTSLILSNSVSAQTPTNSFTNGVWFSGSTFLTNKPAYNPGWQAGTTNVVTMLGVFSGYAPASWWTQPFPCDSNDGYSGNGMGIIFLNNDHTLFLATSSGSQTYGNFADNQPIDVVVTWTNNIPNPIETVYTNGVLALSTTNGSGAGWVGTVGYSQGVGFFYNGWIQEYGWATNTFSLSDVTSYHTYATNKYHYTP